MIIGIFWWPKLVGVHLLHTPDGQSWCYCSLEIGVTRSSQYYFWQGMFYYTTENPKPFSGASKWHGERNCLELPTSVIIGSLAPDPSGRDNSLGEALLRSSSQRPPPGNGMNFLLICPLSKASLNKNNHKVWSQASRAQQDLLNCGRETQWMEQVDIPSGWREDRPSPERNMGPLGRECKCRIWNMNRNSECWTSPILGLCPYLAPMEGLEGFSLMFQVLKSSLFQLEIHIKNLQLLRKQPFWAKLLITLFFFSNHPLGCHCFFSIKDTFMFPGHVTCSTNQIGMHEPDYTAHEIAPQCCSVGLLGLVAGRSGHEDGIFSRNRWSSLGKLRSCVQTVQAKPSSARVHRHQHEGLCGDCS